MQRGVLIVPTLFCEMPLRFLNDAGYVPEDRAVQSKLVQGFQENNVKEKMQNYNLDTLLDLTRHCIHSLLIAEHCIQESGFM